jgi:hypothetical protein
LSVRLGLLPAALLGASLVVASLSCPRVVADEDSPEQSQSERAGVAARPAAADGTLREQLSLSGATFDIEIDPALSNSKRDLLAWITSSVDTVARYYGQFPARAVALRLSAHPGDGVQGGMTTNSDGARIRVRVGVAVTPAELADDWVLVHEMIHLALPELGSRHVWLSEGLATYVEGIARAQAGRRAVTDVWAEYLRSMPLGVPREGEGGLDETHTWARTYWGGALFCLLADVSIREHSSGRYSLRDGLVAILRATGGYAGAGERGVDIDVALRIADAAVHSTVLTDLYDAMKEAPVRPDPAGLWEQLGVRAEGGSVRFDDAAPLAGLREAMTRQSGPPAPSASERGQP